MLQKHFCFLSCVLFLIIGVAFTGVVIPARTRFESIVAQARTIAIGIPGAGAVARVGDFDNHFSKALESNRVLVASTSNFGASVWILDPGTILSIDPDASDAPLVIPQRFAVGGGQISTLDGAVMVLTSNNTSFVNSILNPTSITQILSSVSVPTGIVVSNSSNQVAVSSSTGVRDGEGWEALIDSQGRPFKGLANFAGGVFAGARTNRDPIAGLRGGLIGGSMGTAYLGKSGDKSDIDVFAVTNGDGSVAQVHLQMGVDGLVLTDTLASFSGSAQAQESYGDGAVMNTRGGMVFQAEPNRLLFICDPSRNAIRAFPVFDTGTVFRTAGFGQLFDAPELSFPVDVAPVKSAISGPISNTTLAPGSDIYVANRGNGTIVRMNQSGEVVAVRKIKVDSLGIIGPGWVNGIGLSQDGQLLYITLTGSVKVGDQTLHGLLVSISTF